MKKHLVWGMALAMALGAWTADHSVARADSPAADAADQLQYPPRVDPNKQLGCQIHLPILNFLGQDDVCRTWIEVQHLGCEPSKAILVTWGEPGFCPPQASGPLKVECTGLLFPGSSWVLQGGQIPVGAKSGMLFKFTALQLGERDARYIKGILRTVRTLEILGRALMMFGWFPPTWLLGTSWM